MSEIDLKEVIDRTDCDLERKPNEGLFVEISEDYFHWLINEVKSIPCKKCNGNGFHQSYHDKIVSVGGSCDECKRTGRKHQV